MVTATEIALPAGEVLCLRDVCASDARALSDLAFRSKKVWGYDQAFMAKVRAELRWSESDLRAPGIRGQLLADRNRVVAGFHLLNWQARGEPELDALFVHPDWMGRGVGSALLRLAIRIAREEGAREITLESDPFAAGFYDTMGAEPVGERPVPEIPGRSLPLYRISL